MTKARSNATAPAAKGEIVAGTGSELSGILSVGANGTVLTANSATATGLSWAALPASTPANAFAITDGNQSTSDTSYTDLATITSVTLTTGTRALVIVSAYIQNSAANGGAKVSFGVTGATTNAATDNRALDFYTSNSDQSIRASAAHIITGLTAGSNTFTLKFRKTGPSGQPSFNNRSITVIDMGS